MGKPVKKRRQLLALAIGLCSLSLPQIAWAQPDPSKANPPDQHAATKASCAVRVIHATKQGGQFDTRLEPLRPQLTRPPLDSWKGFALLRQHELVIASGSSQTFEVPGDHQGVLSYEGRADAAGKLRLRLKLEIQDGSAKLLSTKFVINNGGTVLQAGIQHNKGLLVLGFTCTASS